MNFSFFGSYQYVYSTVYGFNPKQVGLCYIPVMIGGFIIERGYWVLSDILNRFHFRHGNVLLL